MKRIFLGLVSLILIVVVGVRIWQVNKEVDIPPVFTYEMGEEISIGKNIFLDYTEQMDGYTVTVNRAEMISYEDYLAKYHYEEDSNDPLFEEDDFSFPEMIYDLHVTVKNTNETDDPNDNSGVAFLNYHLIGTDFLLQVNSQLYEIANPDMEQNFMMGFRLRPDSEMDFHLPFFFSPSSIMSPIQVDTVMKDDVYLTVSKYPEAKLILIE